MRPISITLTNFGPFLNEYIDFRNVHENQLFLISGKTGSGKTMIFDAIVYALFGEASTKGRKELDLRSHFADGKSPMTVVFEFKLGDSYFKVERQGAFYKEGNVSKTNGQLDIFQYIEDGYELRESKITAGNQMLKDLLGVDAEQFRQLFILPQGEFKRFLLSKSIEKQEILRTLFDSQRFEMIQKQLTDDVKESRDQIERNFDQLENYWHDIETFNDASLQEHKATPVRQTEQLLKVIPEFERTGNQLLEQLTKQQQSQQQQLESIQQQLEHNKQLQDNFHKLQQNQAELAKLNEREPEIEDLKQTLTKLNEVKPLANLIENKKTLDEKQLATEQQLYQVEKTIGQLVQEQTELQQHYDRQQNHSETIEQQRQFLSNTKMFYQHIEKYKTAYNQITDIQQVYNEQSQQLTEVKERIEQLHNELKDEQPDYEAIEKIDQQIYELTNQIKEYQRNETAKQQYIKNQEEIEQQQAKLKAQERQLAQLTASYNDIDQVNLQFSNKQEAIAQIQTILNIGDTCPVCGNEVHDLAQHIDFENLSKRQQELSKLEHSMQQCKEQIIQHTTTLEHLTTQQTANPVNMDETYDIAELEQQLTQIQDQRTAAKQRNTYIQNQRTQLQQLEQQAHTLELDLKKSEAQYQQNETLINDFERVTQCANTTDFVKTFDAQNEDVTNFDNTVEQLNNDLQKCQNQLNIERNSKKYVEAQLQDIKDELQTTDEKVQQEMHRIGFTTMAQVQTAIEQLNNKSAIETEINTFEKEKQTISIVVSQLEEATRNQTVANIDDLEQQVSVQQTELTQITTQLNQHEYKVDFNKTKFTAIKNLIAELNDYLHTQQEIFQLSEILAGKNEHKLTLENYVLIHYLERILGQANQRLALMTNQRYQLKRRQQVSQGYSGLEIDVFDAYSNQTRHISSLSGGESFQASLALALGLSEIVQQEAGGIVLSSMFVDEGFGTLDQETLETALDTLLRLKSTGRMVGIISHVSELKQRIPLILEVTTEGYQSVTQFKQQ